MYLKSMWWQLEIHRSKGVIIKGVLKICSNLQENTNAEV